jgi:hypothetical protein
VFEREGSAAKAAVAAKDALIRASDLSGSPKDIIGKRKTRNVTNGSDFSPHKSPTNDKAGVSEAKEPGHREATEQTECLAP